MIGLHVHVEVVVQRPTFTGLKYKRIGSINASARLARNPLGERAVDNEAGRSRRIAARQRCAAGTDDMPIDTERRLRLPACDG